MFEIKHSASGTLPETDFWLNLPIPSGQAFGGELTWDLLERLNGDKVTDAEAAQIEEALAEMPHFTMRPLTTEQYEEARARSTVLKQQFRVNARGGRRGTATATLEGSQQRAERIFHESLLKRQISAVKGMVARDVDSGTTEKVATIERFLEVVALAQSGTEYLDQLIDGLVDESTLDAGSKNRSTSQRVG